MAGQPIARSCTPSIGVGRVVPKTSKAALPARKHRERLAESSVSNARLQVAQHAPFCGAEHTVTQFDHASIFKHVQPIGRFSVILEVPSFITVFIHRCYLCVQFYSTPVRRSPVFVVIKRHDHSLFWVCSSFCLDCNGHYFKVYQLFNGKESSFGIKGEENASCQSFHRAVEKHKNFQARKGTREVVERTAAASAGWSRLQLHRCNSVWRWPVQEPSLGCND